MTDHLSTDAYFTMVPDWVLKHPDLSDRALRVWTTLMSYARGRNEHVAFPGRKTLAVECRCSANSLDRAIAELVAAGTLTVERRFRPDGSQGSNLYHLQAYPPHLRAGGSPRVGTGVPTDGEAEQEAIERDPLKEKNTPAADATAEDFDAFWAAYPRKVGKGDAIKAYRAATRKADAATILAGVSVAAAAWRKAGTDVKFIPYPATWLKAERWQDDPAAHDTRGRSSDTRCGGAAAPASAFTGKSGYQPFPETEVAS